MFKKLLYILICLSICASCAYARKSLQDRILKNVMQQKLDYSCGIASIGTILKFFYLEPVTEKYLIKNLGKTNNGAEFGYNLKEMSLIIRKLHYKPYGCKIPFDKLNILTMKNKIPIIVLLNYKQLSHFVVCTGVNGNWIYLKDPSSGQQKNEKKRILTIMAH